MNLSTVEIMVEGYSSRLSRTEQDKKGTEKEHEYRVSLITLLMKEREKFRTDSPTILVIDELIGFNMAYAHILTGGDASWISRKTKISEGDVRRKIEHYEEYHSEIIAQLYPKRAKAASLRS